MLHGYNPPHRFLPYLSWTEIAALPDKANTVIVLPTGATEQHGPHLPCAVDTVISAGVVGHALARLPDSVPAYAMAPITYGKSEEHLHFPGTVTLSGETLLATMNEVGESVYRAGFRKLLLVNGHGGQPQVMEMAARELRLRHGDFIVCPASPGACRMWPAATCRTARRSLRCMPAMQRPPSCWRWRRRRCAWTAPSPTTRRNFRASCSRPTAGRPAPGAHATSDPAA
jgi:hypothetical protein